MFVSLLGSLLLMAAPMQDLPASTTDAAQLQKAVETTEPLVVTRMVGRDLRVAFYRQDGTIEHVAVYHPNGTGYSIWYQTDGKTRSHHQLWLWRIQPYLEEGKFGYQYELQFHYLQVDKFDKTGKWVEKRLMFHNNGATIRIVRDFRAAGVTSQVEEYRFDGTLQVKTEYARGKTAKRTRYSQADGIKPNVDPALLTLPNMSAPTN